MIDSHAHLSYENTLSRIDSIVQKFKNVGGTYIINIATGIDELASCISIQRSFSPFVQLCYGVHPERIHQSDQKVSVRLEQSLKELQKMNKTVEAAKTHPAGIGETGFDLFKTDKNLQEILAAQETLFIEHLSIAKQKNLPIIIHARGVDNNDYSTHYKAADILEKYFSPQKSYFHSFTGNKKLLDRLVELDSYIGINGVISYQNISDLKSSLPFIPKNRLLLETDSPFLIPSNMDRNLLEDKKCNEPMGIIYTAKIIAKFLNVSYESIIEQSTQNAKDFFSL